MGSREIWVYTEQTNNKPASVYYELLAKADEIASEKGWQVASVLIGSEMDTAAEELKASTDKIYIADHESLKNYTLERYAAAMETIVRKFDPEMILIGATGIGSELAPTVAGKMKTGLAAHCIDICVDEARNRINCMVPAFGGKVVSEIFIPEARPMMASIRPGILESKTVNRECKDIIKIDASFLEKMPVREELIEFIPEVRSGVNLETANVVVAAGRGVSNEENWRKVNAVADKLEAGVGWSRNFVDLGIVDSESNMIGTSGKSVKPEVFIGLGISGATHFVCGIGKSKLIINVNRDENAKIFNHSDYGVVGDAGKFLEALEELL